MSSGKERMSPSNGYYYTTTKDAQRDTGSGLAAAAPLSFATSHQSPGSMQTTFKSPSRPEIQDRYQDTQDSNLPTSRQHREFDSGSNLPSLIATSPPRYLTRGSLGSVAFSPGHSPGRRTRTKSNDARNNNDMNGVTASSAVDGDSEGDDGEDPMQHYEHFHNASLLAGLGVDSSPEMQELEAHLSQVSPKTPNLGNSTIMVTSGQSTKRRALPAPLDLSPPRPAWMNSNQPHPSLQNNTTAIPNSLSDSSSLADNSMMSSSSRPAYTGLGLGLPFTAIGGSDSMRSFPSSSSGEFASPRPYRSPEISSSLSPQVPRRSGNSTSSNVRRQRSAGELPLSTPASPESPPTNDRRGLIGLGELSTPRWTAAIHERRWGNNPLPAPMPNMGDPDERAEGNMGEEEDWQGDVLGGYADDESARGITGNRYYRQSMPAGDSYRSFSDIGLPEAHGGVSQSSSAYSLDALSLPDTTGSSSSSNSGYASGAFYTPSLVANSKNDAQDEAVDYIGNKQYSLESRWATSSQNNATFAASTNTVTAPSSATSTLPSATRSTSGMGRESRESARSANASRRSSRLQEQNTKDVPSFMRGTASSSRRSSISSFKEVANGQRRTRPGTSTSTNTDATPVHASRSRPTSPLRAVRTSTTTLPTGHNRQTSVSSNKSKRTVPAPINTSAATQSQDSAPHSSKPPPTQSPSAIAHSILRHTRGSEYEGFDISAYAENDEATAEALRKLDGISSSASPRMSRALSGSSMKSGSQLITDVTPKKGPGGGPVPANATSSSLSRQNSKASNRTSSPHSRPASLRKSWAKGPLPVPGSSKESSEVPASIPTSSLPFKASLRTSTSGTSNSQQATMPQTTGLRKLSLSASISAPALAAAASAQSPTQGPRSPVNLSPTVTFNSAVPTYNPARRGSAATGSGARPGSSSGNGDVPPTPSLSSKRSSSASLAFGTSLAGSRDSTSATSISAYGSPAQGGRNSKARRGSISSDVSSVHSSHEAAHRGDRPSSGEMGDGQEMGGERFIPPVPPLPKDWESYRPSTAGDASQPNSAKDASSFKETQRNYLQSPADSSGSRRTSMEKPAGPRPLRVVSGPAAIHAPSSNSTASISPSLPSPAPTTTSTFDRQSVTSKTPTKNKWSLAGAFGMNKSPPMPSSSTHSSISSIVSSADLTKSSQHRELPSTGESSSQLPLTGQQADRMPSKKLSSMPDIHGMTSSSSRAPSNAPSPGLPSSQSSKSLHRGSSSARPRTDSVSSGGTASANVAPAVVTTSPGRSRSSLLSPRRTPSGIPFFNRRPSAQLSMSQAPAAPGSPKSTSSSTNKSVTPSTPSGGEEKAGRRSILGINLFHRSAARKSISAQPGQGIPLSPRLPQEYQNSTTSVLSPRNDENVTEFGVRPSEESRRSSVSARASNFIGRKRGKTLPSANESPVKPEVANLPPMQMNALPTTSSRLENTHANEGDARATPSQTRPLPVPPRATRLSRATDTTFTRGALPTITGSPSVVNLSNTSQAISADMSKPATPTRIPRLAGNRSNGNSPQNPPLRASVSPNDTAEGSDLPYRRGSLAPGGGMSSSAPGQPSAFLSAKNAAHTPSSSDSVQGSPNLADQTASSSDSASAFTVPRSRQVSAASNHVPATPARSSLPTSSLPSSRASAKVAAIPPSTSKTEKRRSFLPQQEERDSKIARTPLRSSQAPVGNRILSKTQSATPSSIANALISPRLRTRTSDGAPSSAKPSTLTDGLPTSKSSRSIASKLSIPSRISRSATSSSLGQSPIPSETGERSTSSSRYGTPVGEDEIKGDEEMMDFVKRQRTKKSSHGMTEQELDRLFDFPGPIEPKVPLSPADAIHMYGNYLSDYELDEIQEFKKITYVGQGSKKKMASKKDPTNNFGYDDERGDYLMVERDHIMFRYEVVDVLGKGSFGQVMRCRDHQTGEMVAVKIIRNKKRFHHQALVEIKVLENLKRWDPEEKNCVLRIGDHFNFRGHLCITTELLSINLYELIKANSFNGFSTTLIRRFTNQILLSLALLRHHRVVHCDLKPENILLRHPAKSAVTVIDFGSSCFENEKVYTYIQSRFYRSPEVILGMNYHMAIDMWSLGCILAEMYTGYPIFPGENEASQLACIMEVLGLPDKHLVDRSSRKKLFFDSAGAPRPTVDSKGRRRRPGAKSLNSVLKCDDELFVDFIAKCLTWDPDRRMKPGPALRHPFCARGRGMLPPSIPPRSASTSSRSLLKSSNISTPRRLEKKPSESVYSTPSSSYTTSLPNTAPLQRTRTASSAVHNSMGPSTSSYRLHAN